MITIGLLNNLSACWVGAHYSSYNKRLCINFVPFLTLWVCFGADSEKPFGREGLTFGVQEMDKLLSKLWIFRFVLVALALIIVSCLSFDAAANSLRVEQGLFTKHTRGNIDKANGKALNEKNEYIGLQYSFGNWRVNASKFVNSFYYDTYTFGAGYNLFKYDGLYADLNVGYVNGYHKSYRGSKWDRWYKFVYVAPEVGYTVNYRQLGFNVNTKFLGNAFSVNAGLEWRF